MIRIDFNSLEFSGSKKVTGTIFLELDDDNFPSDDWNDFVVIIFTWWTEAFISLIESNGTINIECLFMDGPFQFNVHEMNGEWYCDLVKRNVYRYSKRIIDRENFLNNFLKDINRLLRICNMNDWRNDDISKLMILHQRLRNSYDKAFKRQ